MKAQNLFLRSLPGCEISSVFAQLIYNSFSRPKLCCYCKNVKKKIKKKRKIEFDIVAVFYGKLEIAGKY